MSCSFAAQNASRVAFGYEFSDTWSSSFEKSGKNFANVLKRTSKGALETIGKMEERKNEDIVENKR